MLTKKLYWEKFRPKSLEAMILLPRIQSQIFNAKGELELNGSYIFAGPTGTGKTSLTRLIVPEGALHVNASYNNSIDDLRDEVTDYCRTADIFNNSSVDGFKYVFLDEFDRVSAAYQDALRGFIEEYSDRVRFFATVNNISKISAPMLSRFTVIDFEPRNTEEVEFLKTHYVERAELVRDAKKLNVNDDQLRSIVNLTFPDLRSVMNILQNIEISGGYSKAANSGINVDLYNIVFSEIKPEKTYAWVMENFGDKIENLLKLCGRPLSEYIFEYKPEYVNKVPRIVKSVSNHSNNLLSCIDPVVLALSCIYEIQEIVNSK